MALRNAFQRSSSFLSIRSRASSIPRALVHHYTLPPNARRRFTAQLGWELNGLLLFLALMGGVGLGGFAVKNTVSGSPKRNEALARINDISAEKIQHAETDDISPEIIQHALDQAKEQPFLKDNEEKKAYLMQEHIRGVTLGRDESNKTEAAICLYRARRVYRSMENPPSIIIASEYPNPQSVIEILGKMSELDEETKIGEREELFKQEVSQGVALAQDESKREEAAACYYRALKIRPALKVLQSMDENVIPEPVLDILFRMVARDPGSEGTMPNTPEFRNKAAQFTQEISRGRALCQDQNLDETKTNEAATCFFRAMKVHPSPMFVTDVYARTLPKPVFGALLMMLSRDPRGKGQSQYPTELEEKEAYFMEEVSRGESLWKAGDLNGAGRHEAAYCLYRAMKVHPEPKRLMDIYEVTVPPRILAILKHIIILESDMSSRTGPP